MIRFGGKRQKAVFVYPTSATFAAEVCLGVAMGLIAVGFLGWLASVPVPGFWLATPGLVALGAAWAVGPGMREEFAADSKTGGVVRRVHTLGVPREEIVLVRGDLRLAGLVRIPATEQGSERYLCVVTDWRSRWLVLSDGPDLESALHDRSLASKELGLPEADLKAPPGYTAYWGRLQPPPSPEATLGEPGSEAG